MPVTARRRPPSPPLPPLDALEATHQTMLMTLAELARLLDRLRQSGPDDEVRRIAAQVVSFFSTEARQHHAQEERIVFPDLLESSDAELVQQVRQLQQDHGWLEENWVVLGPQLDALACGYSWVDELALREGTEMFHRMYQEHIALEESLIYPEARRRGTMAAQQTAARRAGETRT